MQTKRSIEISEIRDPLMILNMQIKMIIRAYYYNNMRSLYWKRKKLDRYNRSISVNGRFSSLYTICSKRLKFVNARNVNNAYNRTARSCCWRDQVRKKTPLSFISLFRKEEERSYSWKRTRPIRRRRRLLIPACISIDRNKSARAIRACVDACDRVGACIYSRAGSQINDGRKNGGASAAPRERVRASTLGVATPAFLNETPAESQSRRSIHPRIVITPEGYQPRDRGRIREERSAQSRNSRDRWPERGRLQFFVFILLRRGEIELNIAKMKSLRRAGFDGNCSQISPDWFGSQNYLQNCKTHQDM